jgi:hypothetical protein
MKNKILSGHRVRSRRRRRGTARLFVLGAAFMASTAMGGKLAPRVYAQGTAAAASQAALRFDIPAGPLADVGRAFEALTGLTVSYTNESIRDLQSPLFRGCSRRSRPSSRC